MLANAGIHLGVAPIKWMPAFASMTAVGLVNHQAWNKSVRRCISAHIALPLLGAINGLIEYSGIPVYSVGHDHES